MPRPKKNRKICNPPKMKGFKPFGIETCDEDKIVLQYDEYESVKLVNYDKLPQDAAAEKMEVSRPTLTRVYNSALHKIAQAFVEGKAIVIQGGNIKFEKDWFKCRKCHKLIEGIENHKKCPKCNRFGSDELIDLSFGG